MSPRVRAFVVVGVFGFVVQMTVLFLLASQWHVPYLIATALAVEAAVVHNFAWHQRWTWADRGGSDTLADSMSRLLRFNLGTGLTSIAGNVVGTAIGVELLHLPTMMANVGAVAATTVANFLIADRWVFQRAVVFAGCLIAVVPSHVSAAEPAADTVAAWNRHITTVEAWRRAHPDEGTVSEPEGRTLPVPGGTIHEWRGTTVVRNMTVSALVNALQTRGLPPPAEDILDSRLLSRQGSSLRVYIRVTRSAIITVTYDTEHDVSFSEIRPGLAMSRSASTSIRALGSSDRGFLWRLNSYWRYRQNGPDVVVDVLSETLSRDVPALARPLASPVIDRIARDSLRRSLYAVERFANSVRDCQPDTRVAR